MKRFDELTPEQQQRAIDKCASELLCNICEGMKFADDLNGDDLQARIDAAAEKADEMRTPWFVSEYIMDTCRDEIMGMARAEAEDALYSSRSEHVIPGIV